MSPRAKRHADPQRVLSRPALLILKRMVAGDPLWGERYFPYPYVWKIQVNADVDAVSAGIVNALITHGVVTASQPNPSADRIDYTVTAEGIRYAKSGPKAADDSQLDWVGAA